MILKLHQSPMASAREVSTMIKQGFISDSSISLPKVKVSSSSKPYSVSISESRHTFFDVMSEESKHSIHEKLARVLSSNLGYGDGDVKLTLSGRDGFQISMDVHTSVLSRKSRFFAQKLNVPLTQSVEICDCDDVDIYVQTLVLMYSDLDLKNNLMGEDVSKVLALLKVSAAIIFEAGILSCLEYLEAVPWSEDEEEKVITCLTQLELHEPMSEQVLHRLSTEPSTSTKSDGIFIRLLTAVLQAKDHKARKQMKSLISRLLTEDATHPTTNYGPRIDVSKDVLYGLCHRCLSALILCLSDATCMDESKHDRGSIMFEIAREADNLQWIVEIMTDKKMGDEFVKLWADQKELATLHSKIPTMYRHQISRVTAQLCIAIGRGQLLVSKEIRYSLVSTWLEPLYEDFGWMRRSVDKKLVEDGLTHTILTLPLPQQQSILMNWFDRFLAKGDDCPNIQRAFEIWWRRAFIRQYVSDQDKSQMQITLCDYPS